MTTTSETKKTKSSLVTAEALFGKPAKRRFVFKEVDGFGEFRIQNLNAGEQNKLNRASYSKNGDVLPNQLLKSNARLVVACVVDDEGSPVFADSDIDSLLNLDAAVFIEVVDLCSAHCGFSEEAVKN